MLSLSSWALQLLLCLPLLVNTVPVETPPGNEYDDTPGSESCTYKTCGERGNKYWNLLMETLQDPDATDRTDGCLIFQESYNARCVERKSAELDLWDKMKTQNIDPTYLDTWITSDNEKRLEWEDVPYVNSFNTRDGIIVAEINFKEDDRAGLLQWSELMYHTWHRAAAHADLKAIYDPGHQEGGALSNLQTIVQKNVVNVDTMAIMRIMYENNGLRPMVSWDWIRWTEDAQPAFWKALIGTDNVRGAVYLLRDHSQEIGRKIITEVWTKWDADFPDIWSVVISWESY
ncbi:MAG: hypothetical protein Q9169_004448 [Polycauliona sp. 2 TL-2023]